MNTYLREEKYTDPRQLAHDWYMSNLFGMAKPAETVIKELGVLLDGVFSEGALAQTTNFTLKKGQSLTFQKPPFLVLVTEDQPPLQIEPKQ